ncbi:hypothetical protein SLE2022_257400 [Rubroshorea leprosula]
MEDRWRTNPWWLKASSVYESDEFESNKQSKYHTNQLFGNWSLPFDEKIEQPQQFEKEPLIELMALPTEYAYSKRNVAQGNGVVASRKLVASKDGGKNNDVDQPTLSPTPRENLSNTQANPTSTFQAHENSNEAQCNSGLNINVDEALIQENQGSSPHKILDFYQNTDIPKLITGLHRGIREKSAKMGKWCKRQSQKARALNHSLSDNFIEKKSRINAKDVDELDRRRFLEFG